MVSVMHNVEEEKREITNLTFICRGAIIIQLATNKPLKMFGFNTKPCQKQNNGSRIFVRIRWISPFLAQKSYSSQKIK